MSSTGFEYIIMIIIMIIIIIITWMGRILQSDIARARGKGKQDDDGKAVTLTT